MTKYCSCATRMTMTGSYRELETTVQLSIGLRCDLRGRCWPKMFKRKKTEQHPITVCWVWRISEEEKALEGNIWLWRVLTIRLDGGALSWCLSTVALIATVATQWQRYSFHSRLERTGFVTRRSSLRSVYQCPSTRNWCQAFGWDVADVDDDDEEEEEEEEDEAVIGLTFLTTISARLQVKHHVSDLFVIGYWAPVSDEVIGRQSLMLIVVMNENTAPHLSMPAIQDVDFVLGSGQHSFPLIGHAPTIGAGDQSRRRTRIWRQSGRKLVRRHADVEQVKQQQPYWRLHVDWINSWKKNESTQKILRVHIDAHRRIVATHAATFDWFARAVASRRKQFHLLGVSTSAPSSRKIWQAEMSTSAERRWQHHWLQLLYPSFGMSNNKSDVN